VVVCSRIMFTGIHVSGATLFQAMFVQSIMNIPFGIFLLP